VPHGSHKGLTLKLFFSLLTAFMTEPELVSLTITWRALRSCKKTQVFFIMAPWLRSFFFVGKKSSGSTNNFGSSGASKTWCPATDKSLRHHNVISGTLCGAGPTITAGKHLAQFEKLLFHIQQGHEFAS